MTTRMTNEREIIYIIIMPKYIIYHPIIIKEVRTSHYSLDI